MTVQGNSTSLPCPVPAIPLHIFCQMIDKLLRPPPGPAPGRALPALPAAPGRALRVHTSRTSHKSQLSPVSEIPHPSEIQNMQLEIEILTHELATARRQTGEMERQVALLKVDIQNYKRRINRQNHLVAQIAHTIKLYSSDPRVEAERTQHTKLARPEMEQVPRQDSGWI